MLLGSCCVLPGSMGCPHEGGFRECGLTSSRHGLRSGVRAYRVWGYTFGKQHKVGV